MNRVEKEIGKAPDRVRYCMNGFVIAVGGFLKDLTKKTIDTGKKLMGKGNLGKKRKTAKC